MSWLWSINMPAYVLFSPHRISFTAPTVGFPVQWSSAHRSFLLANIMYLSAVVTWGQFNNSPSTKIHHIYTLYRWIVYTFASKAALQQTRRCSAASWRFCLPLSLSLSLYIHIYTENVKCKHRSQAYLATRFSYGLNLCVMCMYKWKHWYQVWSQRWTTKTMSLSFL